MVLRRGNDPSNGELDMLTITFQGASFNIQIPAEMTALIKSFG